MPPLTRLLLAGVAALALVAGGGGAWWWLSGRGPAEMLPTPPEPPRLSDAPEYERCLDMLEDDPEGARRFADSWGMDGGGESAAHCAALAALSLGEAERAAEALERIAARSQAGIAARAAVFGQAGEAWTAAGKPQRAHAALTLALALVPADAQLLTARAVALLALDRPSEALDDLDHAVAADGSNAESWVLRASALRRLDRVGPAAESVAQALRLEPDNVEALLERGVIRQIQGDASGARSDWERVIELAPDGPTADLAAQNMALIEAGPAQR
ncbi:tetratricopeptide repeat protein [Neoroseomonas oryzicola]|uniref:Tetratricopeptide repeat protein n=1 Tax=Neoroseomonas oryzicola TaxID=535904 RepID=A0A9X9WGJ9_9PROT|nr:tetratricopeptide repeat protein [Neoroseomonas oryzicola]MBR0659459.1 tetratricopeptide repeat protein [Neoroseomonas oryzicola]NKE16394.1 tetratricopeptide repeat protein [Neoroseomonas oryzicola]